MEMEAWLANKANVHCDVQMKQNYRPCNEKTTTKMSFAFTIFPFLIDILGSDYTLKLIYLRVLVLIL